MDNDDEFHISSCVFVNLKMSVNKLNIFHVCPSLIWLLWLLQMIVGLVIVLALVAFFVCLLSFFSILAVELSCFEVLRLKKNLILNLIGSAIGENVINRAVVTENTSFVGVYFNRTFHT